MQRRFYGPARPARRDDEPENPGGSLAGDGGGNAAAGLQPDVELGREVIWV